MNTRQVSFGMVSQGKDVRKYLNTNFQFVGFENVYHQLSDTVCNKGGRIIRCPETQRRYSGTAHLCQRWNTLINVKSTCGITGENP